MVTLKEIINPMIATLRAIAKSVYFGLLCFQKRELVPTPDARPVTRISLISTQHRDLLNP